jgi:opacity protein-like surface antigen
MAEHAKSKPRKGNEKMKRLSFLLILILIISLSANSALAQLTGAGIKIGVGFAKLSGSNVQETESKTGFTGGGFITFAFNDIVAIQPEAYYSFKGAEFSGTDPDYGEIKGEVKYDYVEIPILIKAMLPTSSNFEPSIFIGPSFGILTNAKLEVETSTGQSDSRSIREESNKTDLGLSFGAGISYELTKGKISLEGRYSLGLSSTFERLVQYGASYQNIFFTGDDKLKNSAISIILGFSFM